MNDRSQEGMMGMTVCGRDGLWVFRISRVLPSSACNLLGRRETEAEATDLMLAECDWLADRDASLAVERAAEMGTARVGPFIITLEPV
jgi:hypothetical protein